MTTNQVNIEILSQKKGKKKSKYPDWKCPKKI